MSKIDLYTDLINSFEQMTPTKFDSLTAEEQDKLLTQYIIKIREINKLPVLYYDEESILSDIQECIDKIVCFHDDKLETYYAQGLTLLDYLFPNLHKVKVNGKSVEDRWNSDADLARCLRMHFETNNFNNMRTAFLTNSRYIWSAATNFPPMRAKAIFERFTPKEGVIYDYCAGFGGRMLGALSSDNNYHYIATDPNHETYINLEKLGEYIRKIKPNAEYEIYNDCAENHMEPECTADFIFSCPPFYDLEIYCDAPTQSVNKFKNYNDWLEGFVRPTIRNCYKVCKDTGVFGFDIMNVWSRGKFYSLVDDWKRIAIEEGFIFKKAFPVISHARKSAPNADYIYLFTKGCELPDYTDADKLAIYKKDFYNNRNDYYRRTHRSYAEYDIFGKLITQFADTSDTNILEAVKTKKIWQNKYYRIYRGYDDVLDQIDVKQPICEINGNYYYSFAEVGQMIGVSRQAVHQTYNRKKDIIKGYKINWLI